jgi:hypothetical protein
LLAIVIAHFRVAHSLAPGLQHCHLFGAHAFDPQITSADPHHPEP